MTNTVTPSLRSRLGTLLLGATLAAAPLAAQGQPEVDTLPTKELRIGLICYGGVSLAPGPLGPRTSLVPEGHTLDLFVTTTDYAGANRAIELQEGVSRRGLHLEERTHSQVMHVAFEPSAWTRPSGEGGAFDPFAPGFNPALAFMGRATSSFPVAFAPIRIRDVAGFASGRQEPEGWVSRLFPSYEAEGNRPEDSLFIDGGVCLNRPFGPVPEAILQRPAAHDVERVLVYLEPDPDPGAKTRRKADLLPGALGLGVAALVGIPNEQPILGDLLRIRDHNDRVAFIDDLLEGLGDRALAFAREVNQRSGEHGAAGQGALRRASDQTAEALWASQASASRDAYLRVRTESILDPEASNQAALVRQVLRA
jgi:patatin-related protein